MLEYRLVQSRKKLMEAPKLKEQLESKCDDFLGLPADIDLVKQIKSSMELSSSSLHLILSNSVHKYYCPSSLIELLYDH